MATKDEEERAWDPADIDWNPDENSHAIWVEKEASSERVVMIRHPSFPFAAKFDFTPQQGQGHVQPPDPEVEFLKDELFTRFALEYLRRVKALLGLGDETFTELGIAPRSKSKESKRPAFQVRWFSFNPPLGRSHLCGSFWVRRFADPSMPDAIALDRTAVLLAGMVFVAGSTPLLAGQGLRVMSHWTRSRDDVEIRITGAVVSLPTEETLAILRTPRSEKVPFVTGFLNELAAKVLTANGLSAVDQVVAELGLAISESDGCQLQPTFPKLRYTAKTIPVRDGAQDYGYKVEGRYDMGSGTKTPLTAFAVRAKVYRQDPSSRVGSERFHEARPARGTKTLEAFRSNVVLPNLVATPGNPGTVSLAHQYFTVCQCALAGDPNPNDPKELAADRPGSTAMPTVRVGAARSNTFAAVNAYYHASDFFDRMLSYGLSPAAYFNFANPSLQIRYRSGLTHGAGKGGSVVNAQVNWSPKWQMGGAPPANVVPGELQVRFAMADLTSVPRRSPMGMATDPRWNWHEFGHVLIAAAIGEVEFRFAHSAGDALAAILHDPDSRLADHTGWRGVTFPWVLSKRRHDRKPADGWGWNGPLYRRERSYTAQGDPGRAQYWAEQILSSTLFTLYLAIGGDAKSSSGIPDRITRHGAANYATYLVMKAIKLLGPDSVVQAKTPDQFASALIDADIGTSTFQVPPTGPKRQRRLGGAQHKVIHWAFEQQGLYAAASGAIEVSHPVDLYIEDGRSGTYTPISFVGDSWHALESALWSRRQDDGGTAHQAVTRNTDNYVFFNAVNAGRQTAAGVEVSVWVCRASAGSDWLNGKWAELQTTQVQAATVAAGATQKFGAFKWRPTSAGKYFVLAIVTCPADRANSDTSTGLPCALHPSPIPWLVALDNNLGLREISVV